MINKILVQMREINNKNHKIKPVTDLKRPNQQVPTYKGTK